MECGCSSSQLRAVHLYLKKHFPECAIDDFHAPTRLEQADIAVPAAEHHVVKITRHAELPHYAVFLKEFLGSPAEVLADRLQQWNVEEIVRANLVAIIARDGASPL